MDDEVRSRLDRVERRQDDLVERLPVVEHRVEAVEGDITMLAPKLGDELDRLARLEVQIKADRREDDNARTQLREDLAGIRKDISAQQKKHDDNDKLKSDRKWLAIAASISLMSLLIALVFGVLQLVL